MAPFNVWETIAAGSRCLSLFISLRPRETEPLRPALWSSWQRYDCITATLCVVPLLASGQNSEFLTQCDLKVFAGSNVTSHKQYCWWLQLRCCGVTHVRVSLSVLFSGGDETGAIERINWKMPGHKQCTSILRHCCMKGGVCSVYSDTGDQKREWYFIICVWESTSTTSPMSAQLETCEWLKNKANICTF